MEDRKEKLTKQQLIEKINNERQTFKTLLESKDKAHEQQTAAAVTSVRKISSQLISRFVRSFGQKKDDEYVLDIPAPDQPEGAFWDTRIELVDKDTWRVHCKLQKIPEIK